MKLTRIALGIALGMAANGCAHAVIPTGTTTVKIVAFNDFHGQIESPGTFRLTGASSPATPVGGVDWLAGYIAKYRAENPTTTVVSAGDLIGATPLISALFHDEPTIETMNMTGLEFNAVGNHEFDEGKEELERMQKGGCHPTDPNSCKGAEAGAPVNDEGEFAGADFKFLAANVEETATGKTIFPPYAIKHYGKVRVGFIGMTLKETPTIVTPTGVAGLQFKDEAATVNALIPKLKARGVEAIVVLVHQGGTVPTAQNASTMNSCSGDLEGTPLKPIVHALDDAVDLVISGHTHQAYNCLIANQAGRLIPVTSANSIGRILTDIDLSVDNKTGHVLAVSAQNVLVDRADATVTPDAAIKSVVDGYRALATPIANRVIGSISASLTRDSTGAGESTLGDVIADAQLEATRNPGFGDAAAAFMNPGGIRANLSYASSPAGEGDGKVTYGEAFTVQPFGNSLVTLTLTGAQIHTLLEQQFTGCTEGYPAGAPATGQPFNRILQVSAGFSYEWKEKGTACDNVDPASIKINGVTVDPAASYRVTVNNFMADGGDQLYVLTQGSDRLGGAQDIDALEAYLTAHSPVAPGARDRIGLAP
ncbi:bifunctional UDP-sugar hydrolase/5'-nucleotidase [Methylococcus sp. EFPC2]|uniref:bifunctional metallophosphatase/5'-nucleotidase n=1 Tax=Methylococcus sp. EFPC2 TaxID=2812648 RepID=UPI0019687421|nr:bifunctional metallophosphatase/5'-nucleotidase [Methylococcus sp. EFPC2]QSA97312.1 bifunctional metallophosphatase/5'-nucleotidase [Methylococcus sp. EFPC2]